MGVFGSVLIIRYYTYPEKQATSSDARLCLGLYLVVHVSYHTGSGGAPFWFLSHHAMVIFGETVARSSEDHPHSALQDPAPVPPSGGSVCSDANENRTSWPRASSAPQNSALQTIGHGVLLISTKLNGLSSTFRS